MNQSPAEFIAPTIEWVSLLPIIIVLGGGVLGVLVEAFASVRLRRPLGIAIGVFSTLGAFMALAYMWGQVDTFNQLTSAGEIFFDAQSVIAQGILAVVGFMSVLVAADRTALRDGAFAGQPSDRPGSWEEELTERQGYQRTEIFPLMLLSLGGMMVFPIANSFIGLFVALEVMSLPLYILAATARRRRQISHEAALKYFILGAFASGFFLMGLAFIYGVAGTLTISKVASVLSNIREASANPQLATQVVPLSLMMATGILMVMVGLLFKVGAAPFHAWTPDVYTGAPTPVTGFMAAAVKVSAFAAMMRFYQAIGVAEHYRLLSVYFGVVVVTIAVGTFAGLVQTDIKRMLAYSSIAHTGYILMGVFTLTYDSLADVFFYLLAYALSTVGVFALIPMVRGIDKAGNITGEISNFRRWAGLGRQHPIFGATVCVFLLSFAGIPLTSGFIAKFMIFKDAYAAGLGWLVLVGLVSSVITAFFYFRVIRVLYFEEPTGDVVLVRSEGYSLVVLLLAVLGTIILGVFPGIVLSFIS